MRLLIAFLFRGPVREVERWEGSTAPRATPRHVQRPTRCRTEKGRSTERRPTSARNRRLQRARHAQQAGKFLRTGRTDTGILGARVEPAMRTSGKVTWLNPFPE